LNHLHHLAAVAYNVIGPIVVLVGAGYLFGRKVRVAADVLTKVFLHVFLPAFLFLRVISSNLEGWAYGYIVAFSVAMLVLLYLLARGVSMIRRHDRPLRGAFLNSAMFYNSANFALPVMTLAFAVDKATQDYAIAVQSVVAICQGLAAYTVGAFIAAAGSGPIGHAAGKVLRMPYMYAIALALVCKAFGVNEHTLEGVKILWEPLGLLSAAYVPVALMSLGAQIAIVSVVRMPVDLSLISCVRLLGGPLLGLGLACLMGLTGTLAQVLVIGVAGPTAVASAVVAFEFKNRPDFASSTVLVSTLAAGLTVPITIFLVQNFL
jgi:hypothetical protein